jgi:hypothetical protein
MKPRRFSLPMILAIFAMLVAWLVLGFANCEDSLAMLLVGITRMLLMTGMVVCGIATVIAASFGGRPAVPEKPKAGAGAVVAILLGLLAAGIAGLAAWDAAFGGGGSGEWEGLGDLVVFAFALAGGIASLVLALCLRSMPRFLRWLCIILAIPALGLPFSLGPLRKARRQHRVKELMNSEQTRRVLEEARKER